MEIGAEATLNEIDEIRRWLADIRQHVGHDGSLDAEGERLVQSLIRYMADRDLFEVEVDGKLVSFDLSSRRVVRGTIIVAGRKGRTELERRFYADAYEVDVMTDPVLVGITEWVP